MVSIPLFIPLVGQNKSYCISLYTTCNMLHTAYSLLLTLTERLDLDGILFKGSLMRNTSQLILGHLQKRCRLTAQI